MFFVRFFAYSNFCLAFRNANIEETAAKESNYSELNPNNREYEHIYTGLTKSKENKPSEEKVQYSNILVKH